MALNSSITLLVLWLVGIVTIPTVDAVPTGRVMDEVIATTESPKAVVPTPVAVPFRS